MTKKYNIIIFLSISLCSSLLLLLQTGLMLKHDDEVDRLAHSNKFEN